MTLKRWRIAFFSLLGTTVLLFVGGIVLLTNEQNELGRERLAASEQIEDLEDEVADLEDELEETTNALRNIRRKYREVSGEVVDAEEAKAFAVEGLSADGTNFTCLDFRCLQVKATITFFNDTDTGSSVTCVIAVNHTNGKVTHDTFSSPYVPPEGEDNQRWFYYSPLSGTEIETYDIGDCRRDNDSTTSQGE